MKYISIGFFIALSFFILLLFTLSDYGVHEDNLFHFMRGQYFLQKFTGKSEFENIQLQSPVFYVSGQRISVYKQNPPEEFYAPVRSFGKQVKELKFLDTSGDRSSFYKSNVWGKSVWEGGLDQGHPPVSDIFMAFTNRIFYEKMGIAGDIEGYYIYIVFVSSLGVFFVYLFSKKVFGETTAIFAAITLALFPYYFSESHFNTKDTIQMSFFTGSLVSLYFFVINRQSKKWFACFISFTFLALGTKWNIGFLPIIFLPWFFLVRKKEQVRKFLHFRQILIYSFLGIIIPLILLIISWPYLWTDTWIKLIDTFNFYRQLSFLDPRVDTLPPFTLPLGFNLTPILRVITMTPPFTLILFIVGLSLIIFRKIKMSLLEEWLILFWFLVPILRVSRQTIDTGGSIRHFIEFLPALVIISGIGGAFAIKKISSLFPSIKKLYITIFCIVIYVFVLVFTLIQYHPNENIYFNFLSGGFSNAWKSGLYSWKGSYDNVYRQGAVWMNLNSETNAKIAYIDGTMLAISPVWLRDDIYFGSYFSGFEQKGEYTISLIYPKPPSVFAYLYLDRFLTPVYELKIDGVAVLKIWQNSKKYLRPEFSREKQILQVLSKESIAVKTGRAWKLDLSKTEKITRIIFVMPEFCANRAGGVWNIVYNGESSFIVPQEVRREGEIEIDFPAEEAESIRFWDVDNNSCLYQAEISKIYAL